MTKSDKILKNDYKVYIFIMYKTNLIQSYLIEYCLFHYLNIFFFKYDYLKSDEHGL